MPTRQQFLKLILRISASCAYLWIIQQVLDIQIHNFIKKFKTRIRQIKSKGIPSALIQLIFVLVLLILNRKLRTAGIIIQQDLFGSYVAFVNETRVIT